MFFKPTRWLIPITVVFTLTSASPVVQDQVAESQNFYPSFFRESPMTIQGHSRPFLTTYTRGHRGTAEGSASANSVLGSGDFGVLRGGTFYQDDDKQYATGPDVYGSYYSSSSNGHGGPYTDGYFGGYRHDEQFANFRDFADFNAPADPAYSEYVVVYANPGASGSAVTSGPKNIIEQLAMLDEEKMKMKKKQSLGKRKLALLAPEKKRKQKSSSRDEDKRKEIATEEPLLALS